VPIDRRQADAERARRHCGLEWIDLGVAELLLYNVRHVQHHAAQLNLILRQTTDSAPSWVATSPRPTLRPMAAWQCAFLLAPRAELRAGAEPLPEWLPADRVRDTLWWRRASPPADLLARAGAAAPAAPPWSTDLTTFGREDGDRIDVWREGNRVTSVLVRVDLRQPNRRFLGAVVDLARAADAVLLRLDGLVVPALRAALEEAATSSAAARFVADPEAYHRRVRLGGPADA
jgi:hypothetical protein